MVRAQSMRREGVHSRWRWWAFGMWAGSVVGWPRETLRRCAATRWPRWKISTVRTVVEHLADPRVENVAAVQERRAPSVPIVGERQVVAVPLHPDDDRAEAGP